MTSMYDDPPLSDVVQAAAAIVAQHRDGQCQSCRPTGCPEMAWAQPVKAGWEAQWMAAARETTPA